MLARNSVAIEPDNETSWQRFAVNYEYPVSFTEGMFSKDNHTLLNTLTRLEPKKLHQVVVFIDEGVLRKLPDLVTKINSYFECHSESISLSCPAIVLPAGESIKSSPKYLFHMQKIIAEHRIDRHSFVMGIGGGALLDAVGLVAATSHRGIRHIRVPTTVLAQNDSGVGVKNGVNLFNQKNYLGTFSPPYAVINDYDFIQSLPARDKIAGMAEAIKVALIRDGEFFEWLENNATLLQTFDKAAMTYMIRHCAELHMKQIASGGDPFERGSARPLDFGHWSAHRLESLTHFDLRHGEAVAIGIALDARYSALMGMLPDGQDTRICNLLETLGFTLTHAQLSSVSAQGTLKLVEGLTHFKEHLGGELTITLLSGIGSGVEVHEMDDNLIGQSIAWLQTRQADESSINTTTPSELKVSNGKTDTDMHENKVKGIFSSEAACGEPNIRAAIAHLNRWIKMRTDAGSFDWLKSRLQLLDKDYSDRELFITLGMIPRKLGRSDLALSRTELDDAQRDVGCLWTPEDWSIDVAARCLTIATLQQQQTNNFQLLFKELCKTADLNEAIALYRSTALLPQHDILDTVIGTGLRTHIGAIFEAIAHRNPYPRTHFSDHRWNHMVLKALFIDSTLWPIQGIDERANPELAIILCDYADERRAANRSITPELWRCVGPYAKGDMLTQLYDVLATANPLSQKAALLALLACPSADHKTLRLQHPAWSEAISCGKINWTWIGQQSEYTQQ